MGAGDRILLHGHVREPGHLLRLHGVQSVMVGPFQDPLPFVTPFASTLGVREWIHHTTSD